MLLFSNVEANLNCVNIGICLSTKIYITVLKRNCKVVSHGKPLFPSLLISMRTLFSFLKIALELLERRGIRNNVFIHYRILFLDNAVRQKTCTRHHGNTEQDEFSSQGFLSVASCSCQMEIPFSLLIL